MSEATTEAKLKPFVLTLSEEEMTELMTVPGGEPVKKMQGMLREQTADGKHTLSLNDLALGKIVRLMTQGPKKVQVVLKKTIGRPLIEAMQP
jgi:hypothetical protein